MPGGTLTLSYTNGATLEIGTVTSIRESFQKSCTTIPLTSMSADDTFAVDTKSLKVINISFKRVQPESGMNNADWLEAMMEAVDRWQCRTDGFSLKYIPDVDNPYIAEINENGYIKSFSHQISRGENEYIKGSIEFHVGTMYVKSDARHQDWAVPYSEFKVSISDARQVSRFDILNTSTKVSCVESYSLCGGPQSPFEYLTMVVPRNRLGEVAPSLVEEDGIVAGRNAVTVNAVGCSDMTVTKCKLNNNKYTITAYCNADRLRGCTLNTTMELTPEQTIRSILSDTSYGVTFTGDNLVMQYTASNMGTLYFPAGRNVWYVLQVAAMCLGCMIFFSSNKAYVIDYRIAGSAVDYAGDIVLFEEGGKSFVTGNVSLGDEGIDTVVNEINVRATVSVKDPETEEPTTETEAGLVNVKDPKSIARYYTKLGNTIYAEDLKELSEIKEPTEDGSESGNITQAALSQAYTFGRNYLDYRIEPQQSIEFTVKEMRSGDNGPSWSPTYLPATCADSIHDSVDEVTISNLSDITGERSLQKLFLSTYERSYPKGTTTYTWGVLASIDLSSSTSQIVSSIENK